MLLEQELLKTLSFYESMSLEYILLDLDKSFLDTYDKLTTDELLKALNVLEKKKLIQRISDKNEKKWIRLAPKKSFFRKIREIVKL